MFLKLAIFALLVAVAHSSAIHGANYKSFSYGVSDPHTGDVKSRHETRTFIAHAAPVATSFVAPVARAAPISYAALQTYGAVVSPLAYNGYEAPLAYGAIASPHAGSIAYGSYGNAYTRAYTSQYGALGLGYSARLGW